MDVQIKGTPREGLFGATLGFFVGFAAVALFGPTASRFEEAMNLTPAMKGLLVAMPALSGSLLRIPFAAWVDTTGGRKPFLTLLALSLLGMLGLWILILRYYPDNMDGNLYWIVLFLGLLCGCGIATFSVGIGQVSYWYPQNRQGMALGIFAGVGNLAPGLFSFLLPVALATLGLGHSYLAWLAFLALGIALYVATGRNAWYFQYRKQNVAPDDAREMARERGQELFPSGGVLQALGVSARVWKTWALVCIYFTTFGGFIALTAWLPTYWEKFFGFSPVVAGLLTALYSVLASLLRVAGGAVADRAGGERTLIFSLSAMLVASVALTFLKIAPVCIGAEMLLALGMGFGNAAVFKLVPQEVPKAVGGAAGWVGGLGAFGGFAIPPVLGFFVAAMDDVGYARGFSVYVLLAALSLAITFVLRATRRTPA